MNTLAYLFDPGMTGFELIVFVFWIWVIYLCATRERNGAEKVLWLILVILFPVIGSLIYFLLRVVKIRR